MIKPSKNVDIKAPEENPAPKLDPWKMAKIRDPEKNARFGKKQQR